MKGIEEDGAEDVHVHEVDVEMPPPPRPVLMRGGSTRGGSTRGAGPSRRGLVKQTSLARLNENPAEADEAIRNVEEQDKQNDVKALNLIREQGSSPAGEVVVDHGKNKELNYLTHAHVKAIEEGRFIYDPDLVQSVVDIGARLANLDHYVSERPFARKGSFQRVADDSEVRYIDARMTEALLSDVEDFLQVISKMIHKMEFLQEYHSDTHLQIMQEAQGKASNQTSPTAFTWSSIAWRQLVYLLDSGRSLLGRKLYPAHYKRSIDRKSQHPAPRTYSLPHMFEKNNRLRQYGAIFDASLEVANLGTDIVFVFSSLLPLVGTSSESLFYVSIAALGLTFFLRLLIGLWDRHLVDWKDKRRVQKYFFGLLVALVEPNSGFNDLVKESYKVKESLGFNIIGDAVGSFVKDPIATQAKADYKAARMSILTAAVLLVQDIPQIVVEMLYILNFQGGHFEYVYWFALATSILSAARQVIEALQLLGDIPGLRNLVLLRHLVFNPNNDMDKRVVKALEKNREIEGTISAGDDNEVEFSDGHRLVSKALTEFFDYERTTKQNWCSHVLIWAANWLMKILLAPVTLGVSLLWDPSIQSSRESFKHFRDTLSESIVFEGKPFDLVKTEQAGDAEETTDTSPRFTDFMCGSILGGKTTRSVSPTPNLNEWPIFAPLFARMNTRTLYKSIRSLELTDCVSINDSIISLVAAKCPNLQNLNLSFCVDVTDTGLRAFETHKCLALGSVVLDGCVQVTDTGVGSITRCAARNLWRLSLRDLPRLTENVLKHIGDHCTNIRSLNLDVDVVFREHGLGGGNFLLIRNSDALIGLMKRCGSTLRTLRLSNVLGQSLTTDHEWNQFVEHVSPYIRSLSLAGSPAVTGDRLEKLTDRTPFLRELRLSCAKNLETADCLLENTPSLTVLSLGGTRVSLDEANDFFLSKWMPDIEVVQIDHPSQLLKFYTTQLDGQLRALSNYNARPSVRNADGHLAICFPLSCCSESGAQQGAVQDLDVYDAANDKEGIFDDHVEEISKLHNELKKGTLANMLVYNEQPATAALALVVGLVDYVRRIRARKQLSTAEFFDWKAELEDRELDRGAKLIDDMKRMLSEARERRSLHIAPVYRPIKPPFVALNSFGIMSTRRLNLNIDFADNTYEFICSDVFEPVFTLADQGEANPTKLKGNISPFSAVTVSKGDNKITRLLQRYWCIPPSARFYCWAYPLKGLDANKLDWLQNQRYEDTTRRFLQFGGYLYFDANMHFVAASALTVGTTLSFNGPFKLPEESIARLDAEERWQRVTIPTLMPLDGPYTEFCYIFSGETVLPKTLRQRHCQHGCFAYRFTYDDGRSLAYLYSLTTVIDVFLPEEA
ncbi:F-box/LRR-repeat protein 2 [Hondaea fermentalgiana]|uniref:F-box/LRR-repeat protein 2 n=1 Tax=Hondaea fermentalgiana TaxID=2315210 RepID=A0A2R5GLE0_9STRA|nr:F-box/LRR-repeat protein 2 [Hondaea fermentalgiana]|eukprot:GBG29091.1 F-box/LRR-repeat protein 2 [Hondaea fermentalgiana]